MIKLFDILQEITGKPKAIFLAGPAGSGKTYTLKQLLPVEKYEVINIDDTYEELLKSSGLGTNLKDFGPEELSQAAKLMGRAQVFLMSYQFHHLKCTIETFYLIHFL